MVYRILLLLLVAFLHSSCKKEGCTDSAANNYNSSAKEDDGSCNYDPPGDLTFFSTRNTSATKYIHVYLDEGYVGKVTWPCLSVTDCANTACQGLELVGIAPGVHVFEGYELLEVGINDFDTLALFPQTSLSVISDACIAARFD